MLFVIAGILGFITIAGLGFAFAGGDQNAARTAKRAQAIVGGGARDAGARAKAVANTPDARRKQILKTLKEQDRQQKKASLTIAARLRAAGLGEKVQMFWIVSGVLGLSIGLVFIVLGQHPLLALGAAFAAGLGLPRWVVGMLAAARTKKFTEAFSDAILA